MARWTMRSTGGTAADGSSPAAVVRLHGDLRDADVARLCAAVEVPIGRGTASLVLDLRGLARPDVEAVGALARLTMTVERLGCTVDIRGSRDLREIVELMGLGDRLSVTVRGGPSRPGQARVGSGRHLSTDDLDEADP